MFFGQKKYIVSLRGRSGVIYIEGKKTVLIEAEMLTGPTDLVIYLECLTRWQHPNEHEILTIDDKKRIKQNVSEELENKGIIIDWE